MFLNVQLNFIETPIILTSLILLIVGVLLFVISMNNYNKEKKYRSFNLYIGDTEGHEKGKTKFFNDLTEIFNQASSHDPKNISRKFLAAGFYDPRWSKFYLPIKYSILVIGISVLIMCELTEEISWPSIVIHASILLVLTLILPDAYLGYKGRELTRSIARRLPYLLDLMAVCVQTGMTIESSIRYLSKEMEAFDKDMAYLLKRAYDRSSLVGLPIALDEMYQRAPSNEMRSFVMTLTQSLHYGSSIYSVLSTLSEDIREVQLLTIEEKIGKLAAKMSVPLILFIMIPIVILVAAPGVMRMMANV
jgi:tight adherence protein C